MIEFISNGFISNRDDYAIWMFFSKKTQMLRTKFFVSEVLVAEEQTLSPDLLHSLASFV